jgi:hypothetical protein
MRPARTLVAAPRVDQRLDGERGRLLLTQLAHQVPALLAGGGRVVEPPGPGAGERQPVQRGREQADGARAAHDRGGMLVEAGRRGLVPDEQRGLPGAQQDERVVTGLGLPDDPAQGDRRRGPVACCGVGQPAEQVHQHALVPGGRKGPGQPPDLDGLRLVAAERGRLPGQRQPGERDVGVARACRTRHEQRVGVVGPATAELDEPAQGERPGPRRGFGRQRLGLVEQRHGLRTTPRRPARLGRGDEPPTALGRCRGQGGRPAEGGGRGRRPRPRTGPAGRLLQCRRDAVVGSGRGGGEVPGPPVRVVEDGEGAGEGAVRVPAVPGARPLVDRGPHEGVPERDPVREPDQAGLLGRLQHGEVEPQPGRREREGVQAAGVVGRGHRQQRAGVPGQRGGPPGEHPLDVRTHGKGDRQRLRTRELRRGELSGQGHQGQRVGPAARDQRLAHPGGEPGCPLAEQCRRRGIV